MVLRAGADLIHLLLQTVIKTSRCAKKSLPEKPFGSGPEERSHILLTTSGMGSGFYFKRSPGRETISCGFRRAYDEQDGLDTGRTGDHPSVPTPHDCHHGGSMDTIEVATVGVTDLDMFFTAHLIQDAPDV